jgi:FMN phosphatase YigB (HAD superfamily)
MTWILDFDDTLALGPNTWAFETVLPQLIQQHNLPYQPKLFAGVMLKAQEESNITGDDEAILNFVFSTLGWPDSLKKELVHRVFNDYQPALFSDTLPFLERMKGQTLIIVSNNNYAPQLAQALGIADYFAAIITPKSSSKRPKPQADMWDAVGEFAGDSLLHMVGDDPWSDGLFSQGNKAACCYILDRLGRYGDLQLPYHFVKSLDEIIIQSLSGTAN